MRVTTFVLLTSALLAPCALANTRPQPGSGDPHIQTVAFDPQEVVSIDVALGYQLVIGFGTGERIEAVSVGDSGAWQATMGAARDNLFVKPTREATPTNLTVITDQRRYVFLLNPLQDLREDTPFIVSFTYPADTKVVPSEAGTQSGATYNLSGASSLFPDQIYDDNHFTYLHWPKDRDLPAIFRVNGQGQEELVNGAMRDDLFVVEEIAAKLVMRSGNLSASAARRDKTQGKANE